MGSHVTNEGMGILACRGKQRERCQQADDPVR
jgi:hypothetical protein